jgi:hypothetical protein
VIDPGTMRVRGLDGLRVVDASTMPYVTNGNIYAPVVMLSEKAADLIRGNTPLAPIHQQFYRHHRQGESGTGAPVDGGDARVSGGLGPIPEGLCRAGSNRLIGRPCATRSGGSYGLLGE